MFAIAVGDTLRTPEALEEFRSDYRRVVEVVRGTSRPARSAISQAPPLASGVVRRDALVDAAALADYQEALVDVLAREAPPRALQAALLAHPAVTPLREYVESFQPRCLAATALLSRRWARTEIDAPRLAGGAAGAGP